MIEGQHNRRPDVVVVFVNGLPLVVIELKKGRESDVVVGQILKYMGWVAEKLCKEGQQVKGMVICRESDNKLSYALKMVNNVTVKYYQINFKLSDKPLVPSL